ncbi:hypothetical protein Q1695_000349 [Nippostrongylus brasiliensis]|nr:hypothetical protein Q1695_000349 [Nippostrongylus brasiliensis]
MFEIQPKSPSLPAICHPDFAPFCLSPIAPQRSSASGYLLPPEGSSSASHGIIQEESRGGHEQHKLMKTTTAKRQNENRITSATFYEEEVDSSWEVVMQHLQKLPSRSFCKIRALDYENV